MFGGQYFSQVYFGPVYFGPNGFVILEEEEVYRKKLPDGGGQPFRKLKRNDNIKYFNNTELMRQNRIRETNLKQALQEDEEMIILLLSIIEVIQCHSKSA